MNLARLPAVMVMASILIGGRSTTAAGEEKQQPRTDRYGDPLPPAAHARLGTVRLRHGGSVSSLAFSADGKTLASGSGDRTARLWDCASGKELRRLQGHQASVYAVAFSPNGKLLATAGYYCSEGDSGVDHTVRLWDLSCGKLIRVLERDDDKCFLAGHCLAFSPDGKLLAAGSNRTIHLWEAATGKEISRCTIGDGDIQNVAFTADGTFLALGIDAKAAILWDAKTGKQLRRLAGHRETTSTTAVCSLALCADDPIVATSAEDRTIRLWNWKTGKQLRQIGDDSGESAMRLTFSPDGKTLASVYRNGTTVRLWDVQSGKLRQKIQQIDCPNAAVFSADGKTLAIGTQDQTIRLWDTASGRQRHLHGHDGEILSLAFLSDAKRMATVGRDGSLRVWETESGKELRCDRIGSTRISRACLSANGGRLAAVDAEEKDLLCLWGVSSGLVRRRLANVPKHWVGAFALSPDGRNLMASHSDWVEQTGSRLLLWDLSHEGGAKPFVHKILCKTEDEKSLGIGGIAFSADGKRAAVGVSDENIRLIDLTAFRAAAPGAEEDTFARSLPLYSFWSSLALSADGSRLAVGQYYLSFGLFSAAPPTPSVYVCNTVGPFRERGFGQIKKGDSVDAVVFSPDGKMLAAARRDGSILLWETATAKVRRTLPGHQGPVRQLRFSRDGRWLASGGEDTTVLIWDVWKP